MSVYTEKLYNCSHCNKSFTQSGNLMVHPRSHTMEKPYTCLQCDYSCTHAGNLKRHKMSHSREKPHACRQCDYTYATAGELKEHNRIHMGERPYSCKECNVISLSLDTITSGDTGLLTQGSHTSVSRVTIPAQQPVTSRNTG